MIEYREGVSDWKHLIDTIVKNTSLPIERGACDKMIRECLELCIEVYKDGALAGYALIINMNGWRTFHGYKLIPGNSITFFRIARRILNADGRLAVTTTKDKKQVIRASELIGMKGVCIGEVVCLKK